MDNTLKFRIHSILMEDAFKKPIGWEHLLIGYKSMTGDVMLSSKINHLEYKNLQDSNALSLCNELLPPNKRDKEKIELIK